MAGLRLIDATNRHAARMAIGAAAGISGLVFLFVHGACHLLHVAGIDLGPVAARVAIPLFANVVSAALAATGAFALVASVSASAASRGWSPPARALNRAFLLLPALFAVAIIAFP